jgi:hypothetical protein
MLIFGRNSIKKRRAMPGLRTVGIPLRSCLLLLIAFSGIVPSAQRIPQRGKSPFDGIGDEDQTFETRQVRALNVERQKSIVSDTEKLLTLARELNEEIEAGSGQPLTSSEMRKLSEIEKLAHNVKQRMSFSQSGGPAMHDPIFEPSHPF